MVLTARSNATQAMTFEYVNCRGSPRTSQIPRSGWLPNRFEMLQELASCSAQARPVRRDVSHPRLMHRVHHLAINVELQLFGCGVSDADRLGAFVAVEPWDFPLGQPTFPRDPVHDLHLRGIPRHGANQPRPPILRLLVVAAVHQRQKRESRVAQPAEPVVPITRPAELFRQRRRRRGDNSAGRLISESLQGDERANHRRRPFTGAVKLARPFGPKSLCIGKSRDGIDRRQEAPDAIGRK